ncbi:MAG: UDP-N-acetylmuramate:L-alanyl-gamma-D-glutamyl-meso-diaminopimelate ligase [Bdellovibrionales bacterium]|nr:UDP-N-acetylmuramate:L-alanyl-gamma-D-glutamyl-meso-diaminopimelate ligase [Bdellovibrionales bacterium]
MKTVYLMGIGGSGMVSLAGLFVQKGWKVRGSDGPIYPPASDEIKKLNIKVFEGYDPKNIQGDIDLVVVGNVISFSNPEYQELVKSGLPVTSMSQAITDFFIEDRESIVVAGTHGKSTTTSLMAYLLQEYGAGPGFFIGGVPVNFGQGYQSAKGKYFVIEGDEYDTACFEKTPKFLHYKPRHVILTSIEFDHADIYKDLDQILRQFEKLLQIIPKGGTLIASGDDPNVKRLCAGDSRVQFYGTNEDNDWVLRPIENTSQGKRFQVHHLGQSKGWFETRLFGNHNAKNALACIAMLSSLGFDLKLAQEKCQRFLGIRRRQEFLGEVRGVKFYDDFAHHPTAIRETLLGFLPVKKLAGGKLWAIFEPRSNTVRRRVFEKSLPESFLEADEVIIAPVYQKKDQLQKDDLLRPEEVVKAIVDSQGSARAVGEMKDIEDILFNELKAGDVVVFMSNGDFKGLTKVVVRHYQRFIERKG